MVILNTNNEILVGRRLDHPSGYWQMPQGGIDDNENPEEAVWREMMEEIGTGTGLAVLRDTSSIYTLTSNKDIQEGQASTSTPDGAVSALAVDGNSLFAAFAKSGENITVGNGLIFSSNSTGNTINWTYFNQLVDTDADSLSPFAKRFFRGLPITVKEANVTYDASINGNNIYITSWAGG